MRRAGLQADERVKAAVQSHQENGRELEQEAAQLLEQAGEVQKVGLLGAPPPSFQRLGCLEVLRLKLR